MSNEKKLFELIGKIETLDEGAMAAAKQRQDYLAKPPGSLGKLEDISIKIAGITGKAVGNDVSKQCVVIMSSDNGVVAEGVASAPQSVTLSQTINFTRRYTGVSSMAKYYGIDLLVTDVGVAMEIPQELYTDAMLTEEGKIPVKIVNRRIANGTRNLAKEAAMTREEAVRAILIGIEAAEAAKKAGVQLMGVGEMGIGNTTTSSAVLSALTGAPAKDVVGRGGGLNDEGLAKKLKIVDDAVNSWCMSDPIEKLAKVGGYDICAMVGAFLGAGIYRIPVIIDGFISVVAACVAKELNPRVVDYMFASHKSYEIGYVIAMDRLGLAPMFDLGMRLGEGSGCPIAFKIIETAIASMNIMKTLEEASIDGDYLEEIRREKLF
ncbi:MAG: nicotinate-nucleotide--dimethylbenzimidazole phosphoribosyltransferase [Emergencia sp.]|jgi:nicotinate-nucleotide--dimethylbenzimidazole phosphoribosyltransferase|uniref:Nicotinate-nucleotide--dimethylbenzimidazole phosphoribosyltransferase n=1 Tax=Anaerotruncus colihominis TaxID=169435 RepID=A0A845QIM3_9FIRM|nr:MULTISPECIES: nicotinate-nucleotide--dimethylbenzimidazole phosphoribosyltransferase [Anaerotruncus]MCI9475321.1 nicotinate-nucleotide--dimethylbenzimidazole phosphoribosyltransferase [Emergencia sp.]NBH61314.1 nicotinate-nucleotide--dimethylbenzimidazole phosphoribosyltransferase [Anaerotruncus colihominis]NCF01969.1 nicotinate-nucleotide--dimethylbenzimidazole phosphoribosyltransferase [Anaerotruncus sp. 80]